jgi:hypothetical protein
MGLSLNVLCIIGGYNWCLCFGILCHSFEPRSWHYWGNQLATSTHCRPITVFNGIHNIKHFQSWMYLTKKIYHFNQWVFLPDVTLRKQLALPPPDPVDYRAACFCHRQLIDQGHVCSVCLSSKDITYMKE